MEMAKTMSEKPVTSPSAANLAEAVRAAQGQGLPPIHLWNPDFSGDMDMRIARDGTWFHEGGAINRFALARLFATILKREGDRYYLVTPVEKFGITVEDAPFVAVSCDVEGEGHAQMLVFETNMEDRVLAGKNNPIRVARDLNTGEPSPYVMVRDGLEALIDRKTFYRLIDLGKIEGDWFGLWSDGVFFSIIPAAEIQG